MNLSLLGFRTVARLCLAALLLVMFMLYLPFSANPAVFDDHNIITNLAAYAYAQEPFSAVTRAFPYFSIGFVQVISRGDLVWNRWFSIALFALIVVALCFFLSRALSRFAGTESQKLRWAVLCACLWFALNPVAVYSVGYLIQRTIVLATLLSIIAANLYLRALQQERDVDLLSAGLFAGLAMMCKEHAVLLPLAMLALTPLVHDWDRRTVLRASGFLLLMAPVCLWTIYHRGDVVGTRYEIYAGQVLSQMDLPPLFDFPGGTWAMSIATQLGLFLRYAFSWFVPHPAFLSADIRIDFPVYWHGVWGAMGVLLTLAAGLAALFVAFRKKDSPLRRLAAAAFLYVAALYAVELSVVRVQEPFVLYRSFLWAPAYALLLCGVLFSCDQCLQKRNRAAWLAFRVLVPLAFLALIPWTQDRLQSFSSEEALWQDALRKLPSPDVAGADRIYYNLAGEAYKAKRYSEALQFSERVIAQNPRAFQGYLAKGTSLLALSDTSGASRAFDEASAHQPPPEFLGYIEFKRCLVLAAQDNSAAVPACLRRSAKMGYGGAEFRLKMMGLPTTE